MIDIHGRIPGTLSELLKAEEDLKNLEAQIKNRRDQLTQAREQHETADPVYELAISMHDKLCHWNHTDGCGWHYQIKNGIHDWNEHDHRIWLNKAVLVMNMVKTQTITCENVTEFFKAL